MEAGRKTVLIVEDDHDNRQIYSTILEHGGYRVLVAHDGEEGLRYARAERPDLILMDLSMPVLGGWEAIRLLKSDPETADIPTCAISAHVLMEGDYQRAIDAGFTAYLTKPIEPKAVLREVQNRIGPA